MYTDAHFPIYSFLPVQDIGLKFLLNCDFVLVTSRESVRENSWNSHLRDTSADLFLDIIMRDVQLRSAVFDLLPKQVSI
jgi:hypothetical protein